MEVQEFEQAARQYQDTVYRIALNYCRNVSDAEDVTQNTLLRLFRTKQVFESDLHIRNWLIHVAMNESKRLLRSPARLFSLRTSSYEDLPQLQVSMTQEESELYLAVLQIPQKYRIVLYLYYYEEYKTAEIAKLLQVAPSTVTTRLQRGRACLKKTLTETTHSTKSVQYPTAGKTGKEAFTHE